MSDDDESMDKLRAPPDFDGPTGERHCTDILCTGLLVMAWVAMTALGIYSIQNGDYRVVLNPLDFDGNICGTDFGEVDMTDFPYLYVLNFYTGGVCVKECPSISRNDTSDGVTDIRTLITYGGVWQASNGSELPADFVQVADYSESEDALFCTDEDCFPNNSPQESWTSTGINEGYGYAYYVGDSYDWLGYCYLTDEAEERIEELVETNSTLSVDAGNDFWNDLYADLWTARAFICGFGFGVAVIASFIYIVLLRIPCLLNIVVWGSIFLSIAMFGIIGYYAVDQANIWDDEEPQVWDDTTITATRITGYVLWGIGACLALLVICLRKQIQLAIGCVKEAGKAIMKMPAIILLPVLQGAGFIAFMVVLLVYGVHLASLGEVSRSEVAIDPITGISVAFRTYEFDDFVQNSAWYLLFCWFWTSNFIIAVGDMVIAMSVAKWYFTRDKSTVGSCTVVGSFCDVHRYHLGTCAYGSLVIAIVQIIRAIMTRIQKKVKEMDSSIANCVLCCCQCCLWCLEKCLKFLSKNAYIQTAIFGTSFCRSCRAAFYLIFRNAGRVGAITYVSAAILVIGKLFIASFTTGLSYYFMNEEIGDELYSIVGPVVFVYLISYFVSDMFMDIYDIAIDAILHCFIADEEMFDGNAYAEGDLKRWVDKNEEK